MKHLTLTGAACALLLLAACDRLTMENYSKIETGMSLKQVEALIGAPSSCSETLGIKRCQWGDDERHASVNFINDQVVITSAKNLR